MGVMKLFSADSRDCGQGWWNAPSETVRVNSTPDPTNFTVVKTKIVNGYPILWVHYPDVQNYEGNKILMYDKNFDLELISKRIDPHFFTEGDSPIARFVPTVAGIAMAVKLAETLP